MKMTINDINRFHRAAEITLSHLGISKSPIGYDYILDIFDIILCEDNYTNLKAIYLQVGYERGKEWQAIRRAVRRVISKAHTLHKENGWWTYIFGDVNTPIDDSIFIETIYRHILTY